MNNKEGIFNKTEPFRKISPSVLFTNIRNYNYTFNMNQEKKCSKCGIQKPIDNFTSTRGNVYSICKPCQMNNRKNYEDGINADLDELAPHSRQAVLDARELLSLMGYDLNEDINLQFKNRIKVLYGVDIDNPPKRPKNVFKTFL